MRPVMLGGEVVASESLQAAKRHCREELERLPPRLRELEPAEHPYPVLVDPSIMALLAEHPGPTRPIPL